MDGIFLRICYSVEETAPQPSPPLLDPTRTGGHVCSTVQPERLGRARSEATRGERWREGEDAAPLSAPRPSSPPPRELRAPLGQRVFGLHRHYTKDMLHSSIPQRVTAVTGKALHTIPEQATMLSD